MEDNVQDLTKKERKELRREEKRMEMEKLRKSRTLKRFALWLSVVLVVAGAVFGAIKLVYQSPYDNTPRAAIVDAVEANDWVNGNEDSAVELIEYSDFQCPACASYYPLVRQLSIDFGSDVKFVYRHFPLKQHKNAELAAKSAEAAGRQGKFWEMHDKIFEGQSYWENESDGGARGIFKGYAISLGLNTEEFTNDLDAKDVKEKVQENYESGVRAGVSYTPSFFLNGAKIQNPRTYDEFKNIIEQAIQ